MFDMNEVVVVALADGAGSTGSGATATRAIAWGTAGIAFFCIGGHLSFDATHRFAMPLSIDLGGGGGEALARFLPEVRRVGTRSSDVVDCWFVCLSTTSTLFAVV